MLLPGPFGCQLEGWDPLPIQWNYYDWRTPSGDLPTSVRYLLTLVALAGQSARVYHATTSKRQALTQVPNLPQRSSDSGKRTFALIFMVILFSLVRGKGCGWHTVPYHLPWQSRQVHPAGFYVDGAQSTPARRFRCSRIGGASCLPGR